MGATSGTIVVGIDGSDLSLEALRWAARYAAKTGQRVRAVIAWHYPAMYGTSTIATDWDPEVDAKIVIERVVGMVGPEFPGVQIDSAVIGGGAAEVLVEESTQADLLVIGAKGHNALTRLVIGSTSMHCVAHAACPVVVFR